MLAQAALRTVRSPVSFIPSPTLHNLAPRIRHFASNPPGKRPPPPPASSAPPRGGRPPPPRASAPPSSVDTSARQTSPGTSRPKDQTWKAKDGVKFGVAAAAETPVSGARPQRGAADGKSPLEGDARPQEPLAQKNDADELVPGSARQVAHDAQAAAENTPEPAQPSQPLPDLRQGIPSTFDFEYGGAKPRQQQQYSQEEKLDLISADEEPARQQRGGERDYDASAYETSTDRRRAQMANYLYASIVLITSLGAFYLARPFSNMEDVPAGVEPENITGWSPGKMYARVSARFGSQIGYYTEPTFSKLLPDMPENQRLPYTLVISLEDLLIHDTWDRKNGYRTAKRPGVDYFIRYLSQYYELVLFTSAPFAIAEPITRKLDPYHFLWPLYREGTKFEGGECIKDLSYLGRPLSKTIVIDTKASHVKNQPENAIIIPKWEGDAKDPHVKDLVALIPFLEYVATMGTEDVRPVLESFEGKSIPEEFARREAEARRRFLAQLEREKGSRKSSGLSLGSLAGGLGIKSNPTGMILSDGSSVAEGLAKGKMLSDQIREQGQKQYEHLEKQIRENGAKWLQEEEEAAKAHMDAAMKESKKAALGWWGKKEG